MGADKNNRSQRIARALLLLANFDKDDIAWLKPLVMAMVEAAPLLAEDDDTGFMSKVALLTAPAKAKKDKA